VCLVFAELSGKFPVAGAIYQWSRRLAGNSVGWFAGWFMLIGYIVSVSALAIAMQSVLPSIWSGFQLVGDDFLADVGQRRHQRHNPRDGHHRPVHRHQRCGGVNCWRDSQRM
jgi:amino acid transporter